MAGCWRRVVSVSGPRIRTVHYISITDVAVVKCGSFDLKRVDLLDSQTLTHATFVAYADQVIQKSYVTFITLIVPGASIFIGI